MDEGDAEWQIFEKAIGREMDDLKMSCRNITIASK
jgi:hypothetical protein